MYSLKTRAEADVDYSYNAKHSFRRRWFGWLFKNQRDSRSTKEISVQQHVEFSRNMTFNVMPARGGIVVQFRDYNSTTDRVSEILYVIPETEDFAKKIGDIISLELLKR